MYALLGDLKGARRVDVEIRRTSDTEQAYAIAASLPLSFTPSGLELLKESLQSEALFGAYADGELAGFATYRELNPDALELTWLAVAPGRQDAGIGERLVVESLAQIGAGYRACEVKTLAPTNPDPGYAATRRFYHRLGFIALEIVDPYPGWDPGNPCLIMVKFLA
jgi:ribosomal protein S18 acetylase RimI-like enzyme